MLYPIFIQSTTSTDVFYLILHNQFAKEECTTTTSLLFEDKSYSFVISKVQVGFESLLRSFTTVTLATDENMICRL